METADRINIPVIYSRIDQKSGQKVFSHVINEVLESCSLFCLHCGAQGVWREPLGRGDYYAGEEYFCLACEHSFHVSYPPEPCVESEKKQVIDGLRYELHGIAPAWQPQK